MKEFKDAYQQDMDRAATDAENDLAAQEDISDAALAKIADWWKKWFPKAGHKRLARVLLQYAPKEV